MYDDPLLSRSGGGTDPSRREVTTSQRVALPHLAPPTLAFLRCVAPLTRRLALARLERLERGSLTLTEGDAIHRLGRPAADLPESPVIRVRDPGFYGFVLLRGSVGAAESYALGHWDCDDLTGLVRLAATDGGLGNRLLRDEARWARPLLWLARRMRRNTLQRSRHNTEAHYDLGNDFFQLLLDRTLTYSCAVFETPAYDLEEAQIAKYERICRKLELRPHHEVLEIGGGWGGFALHAASRYGCRVVTATLSREQWALARERVEEAGLSERVRVLHQDYRQLRGRFDRLVSIEMIEAVGADYLESFFRICSERLRPDGLMLLQVILTPDPGYAASLRSVDFIKRYIFPGGQLPSLGAICASLGRASDLRVTHLEDLSPHYATTLHQWREAFAKNRERIRTLGYPERFLRLWELYLCTCEALFLERIIGSAQIVLAKPLFREGSGERFESA